MYNFITKKGNGWLTESLKTKVNTPAVSSNTNITANKTAYYMKKNNIYYFSLIKNKENYPYTYTYTGESWFIFPVVLNKIVYFILF